ncbi:MAG: alpha-N-arabinofuranosidase [Clostridiales bacterium]|nr:alpha-N-arabinofuranosidase [Clostridiales bacterium]
MSRLIINCNKKGGKINKEIYGHFSEHLGRCIYGGIYVGENSEIPNVKGMRSDVVEALKKIKLPVLRWPGGCFADEYHWMDGIGAKEKRKKMINTHWGGVVEDNSFGTHEFLEFCEQVGCEPYINGNLGSGTVREMSEWVEYMTFGGLSPMSGLREANGRKEPWKVKYFAVGNENWGCGGNMRPEYYADEYRRYQTYLRNYGDNKLYKIACGPNDFNFNWTKVLMENAKNHMDGLSLHYYTIPNNWAKKGSATDFTEEYFYMTLKKALQMDYLIKEHSRIMDNYDPEKKVALIVDEWGTWYDVEPDTNPGFLYQQNTMRDALVAAVTLNIFNGHCDRVKMANIAQMVNVLQAVILTEGSKMILTPTYHVFDMYKEHQDAVLLESYVEAQNVGTNDDLVPDLHVSASENENGTVHITLANLSAYSTREIDMEILGKDASKIDARVLTGKMDAFNNFADGEAENVKPQVFSGIKKSGENYSFTIPACAVMSITLG